MPQAESWQPAAESRWSPGGCAAGRCHPGPGVITRARARCCAPRRTCGAAGCCSAATARRALAAPREAGLLRIRLGRRGRRGAPGPAAPDHRPPGRPAGHGRQEPVTGVPALQVVEVTATPAPGAIRSIGRRSSTTTSPSGRSPRPADQAQAGHLDPGPGWAAPGKPGKTAAAAADAAEAMLAGAAGHDGAARTVGCFVNTVPMAVAVAGMLRARKPDGRPLRVVMICGQVRPARPGPARRSTTRASCTRGIPGRRRDRRDPEPGSRGRPGPGGHRDRAGEPGQRWPSGRAGRTGAACGPWRRSACSSRRSR